MAMRLWLRLTLLIAGITSSVDSQDLRPLVDLRDPAVNGVTEIVGDWGSSTRGRKPSLIGDINNDGYDDFVYVQILSGACCSTDLEIDPGSAVLIYGGPRESFGSRALAEDLDHTHLLYFKDPLSRFFQGLCDEGIVGLGDIDGDGFDDVLVTLCFRSQDGVPTTGGAVIIFGAEEYPDDISLRNPEVRHLQIVSREEDSRVGVEASLAGDLDGDGLQELVFSAVGFGTEDGERGAGRLFLIYGGFPLDQPLELAEVGRSIRGSIITGTRDGDSLASGHGALGLAGDVNGDGFDDMLVGAPRATRASDRGGAVYIIYGGRELAPELAIADIETFGVEFQGPTVLHFAGNSVSWLGDMDGDGLDDILIGASGDGPFHLGETWIVYGSHDWPSRIALDDPALRTMRIRGTVPPVGLQVVPSVGFGFEVEGLGDVDGDGYPDFFIGANRMPVGFREQVGVGYLVHGAPDLPARALDTDIGTSKLPGLRVDGPRSRGGLGQHAEGRGDIDGDGVPDLLLTAHSSMTHGLRVPPGLSSIFILWGDRIFEKQELGLARVSPESRSATGGERATLHGRGFRGDEEVFFGEIPAQSVELVNTTQLRVIVPPGIAGKAVDVSVRQGESLATLASAFRYGPETPFVDLRLDVDWLAERGYPFSRILDFHAEGPPPPTPDQNVRGFLRNYARDLDGDGKEELMAMELGEGELAPRTLIFSGGTRLPALVDAGEAQRYASTLSSVFLEPTFSFLTVFPGDMDGDGFGEILSGGALSLTEGSGAVLAGRRWDAGLDINLGVELQNGDFRVFPAGTCGFSTAAAPLDLNGDGEPDFALGFRRCRGSSAPVYIYFGTGRLPSDQRPPDAIIWGDPELSSAFDREADPDFFGYDITSAGDMNGDGIGDLIIGSRSGIGRCFLLLGSRELDAFPKEASILDYEAEGRVIRMGIPRWLDVGRNVGEVCDLNGDGLSDVALGVNREHRDYQGAVYVVLGSRDYGKTIRQLDLEEDTQYVVRIDGASPYDWLTHGINLGDFNGDGIDDLGIVASALRNPEARAYVVFGDKELPEVIDLANLGTRGFTIFGTDTMTFSAAEQGAIAGGDFDGDGLRDIALPLSDDRQLITWILYGRPPPGEFIRGEINGDNRVDLSDAIFVLEHLFLGGRRPGCLESGDTNDDGNVDITDAIYLLSHLFLGGPAPPPPYSARGSDPTPDDLDC